MKRLLNPASLNTDLATLLFRLIFGGMFIYHGWPKLANYDMMLTQFTDIIGIGIPLTVILVIFAEVFCGLFIVLGFLTRLSVIPVFITMIVAYFVAHSADPFMAKMLPFVYLCLCPVLFILGSGRYSLDAVLFTKKTNNNPNL